MIAKMNRRQSRLGTALALALALGTGSLSAAASAAPAAGTYRPTTQVQLSVGEGQQINLPRAVADVWTSNPAVADVHVANPRQVNLFGKEFGEATVIATAADGSVVYGANVRVSQNLPSINEVLKVVMPDSDVRVVTVGQSAVLTGTVASPADSALVEQLTTSELNPGVDFSKEGAKCKICVINRLRTATPLQVNLKVKIVEVNRTALKQIGVNIMASDFTDGFKFGIGQGTESAFTTISGSPFRVLPSAVGGTTLGAAGKLFGLNLAGAIDLAVKDGLATVLAEPNLTALSGETASFLAGGEFPIPVSQSMNAVTVEFKEYGVGLAFTPVVLADGRISMRVRPEVSDLSNEGAVKLGDFLIPAITTRRAETTVELGSGQSFMIAGLIRSTNQNDLTKAPFLGDLPILGALFRSTGFRRQETELVIIVTPHLVRPTSGQLATPVDGYRAVSDPERTWEGQTFKGTSAPQGARRLPGPGLSVGASTPATAAAPGFKL